MRRTALRWAGAAAAASVLGARARADLPEGFTAARQQERHSEVEGGSRLCLDFKKLAKVGKAECDVVPVCVQDADSKDVLVVAYINEKALLHTLRTKLVTFWSTSRNELWVKGATSGDTLDFVEARVNCEQNSVLILARPRRAGVCHTKNPDGATRSTCYYRAVNADGALTFTEP
eukprot:TRINITY_DN21784_c0_g1_i2.p1 TRINITY_DN21784_c0_g1~~TRINITY_DN21784_c0_g1_i2.p1  ORF type:complete len:175 (+),score=64.10 TRINITY_DN21784_c0_g1_i2:48-572(+)